MNQIAKDVEKYLPNQKEFAKDIEMYWKCKLVVDVRVTDGIQREDNYAPLDYMILKDTGSPVKKETILILNILLWSKTSESYLS